MSFTRRDWKLVADTLKRAKPAHDAPQEARIQHSVDCQNLAITFKKEADIQGQQFDKIRFLRNCGVKSP
jgi:hypothetical protein